METVQTTRAQNLGDETFMSAANLRKYMNDIQMARASQEANAVDSAEKARKELVKELSASIDLTPKRLQEIKDSLLRKLQIAAERGETELLVMRFPNTLCTDKGRTLNNGDTLVGKPRQAYELWRDQLRPAGFGLKAMMAEWPGGMPGDVGLFLAWGETAR